MQGIVDEYYKFLTQTVRGKTNITIKIIKNPYHVKSSAPFLNTGLKASRELSLISWQFRLCFVFSRAYVDVPSSSI